MEVSPGPVVVTCFLVEFLFGFPHDLVCLVEQVADVHVVSFLLLDPK